MEHIYSHLQLREIFHLEFLRWFTRKVKSGTYAIKGGVNLRFFFGSIRYSEDMDIDVSGINKETLTDTVMGILANKAFRTTLIPFGIERIQPPDMAKAKQTETTQRFKIHLISQEDLYTKIEFSRRGLKDGVAVEPVSDAVTRPYKALSVMAAHYNINAAISQKIKALAERPAIQARDIFDLYLLCSQADNFVQSSVKDSRKKEKAYDNIFLVSYEQFADTVLSYLVGEDKALYSNERVWDEVKLRVANFIGGPMR